MKTIFLFLVMALLSVSCGLNQSSGFSSSANDDSSLISNQNSGDFDSQQTNNIGGVGSSTSGQDNNNIGGIGPGSNGQTNDNLSGIGNPNVFTENFTFTAPQSCTSTASCETKNQARDVVIILDSTTSVDDANWLQLIQAIKSIVTSLGVGSGLTDTRYAVIEFGDTRRQTLTDAFTGNKKLNFLAGSLAGLSADPNVSNISTSRQIRESKFDGLGPAIVKANEYLDLVAREGSHREIWAVHDMSCCGFPEEGIKGTQIQDAEFVKNLGVTIVGIRTLRSSVDGDRIPSPGLAFNVGTDISRITDFIRDSVADKVTEVIELPIQKSFLLTRTVDLTALSQMEVRVNNTVLNTNFWQYDVNSKSIVLGSNYTPASPSNISVTYVTQ